MSSSCNTFDHDNNRNSSNNEQENPSSRVWEDEYEEWYALDGDEDENSRPHETALVLANYHDHEHHRHPVAAEQRLVVLSHAIPQTTQMMIEPNRQYPHVSTTALTRYESRDLEIADQATTSQSLVPCTTSTTLSLASTVEDHSSSFADSSAVTAITKTTCSVTTTTNTTSPTTLRRRKTPQKHCLREKALQRTCGCNFLVALLICLVFNLMIGLFWNPQKGDAPPTHVFLQWPVDPYDPNQKPNVAPAWANVTRAKKPIPGHSKMKTEDLGPLPGYTLQALQQGLESPQGMAFRWLKSDLHWKQYSVVRLRQRFALAVLYFSTNPPFQHQWTRTGDWLSYSTHECDWMTISAAATARDESNPQQEPPIVINLCTLEEHQIGNNESTEVIRRLHLEHNNLVGHLPPELGLLASLTDLRVNDNPELQGQVPDEWSFTQEHPEGGFQKPLWFRFRTLHLQNTQLAGKLPSNLCFIDDLQYDCAKRNGNHHDGLCGCGCSC